MNPPLRFFVYNEADGILYRPEKVASVSRLNGQLAFWVQYSETQTHVIEEPKYGQSTGMNDAKGQELFAGSVVVYLHDTMDAPAGTVAVVQFVQGEFAFVSKKYGKAGLYNPDRVVMVGHQWMSRPELQKRIAQFKAKHLAGVAA